MISTTRLKAIRKTTYTTFFAYPELLQRAFEELDDLHKNHGITCAGILHDLKEELAKPEHEPIGEIKLLGNGDFIGDAFYGVKWAGGMQPTCGTKLYVSPQQQKPLSDDDVLQIINDIDEVEDLNYWEKEAIKRGIKLGEKAHGIT